ncbi:serine/threonine-protein kinase [Streptomyces sp. C10-9-1]|uniref:serine/threonine-protein kinase n=1 Tax=Streptomyces sp. C10-9-1 TaxID=1859285 RepID=UPI003D73A021
MNEWAVPGYTHSRDLGAGAGGRVVLAVHEATGVPVAVKYLGERLRQDSGFVREFRAEARLLGALDSPHVARLYEYVEAPAGAAIVMELVDGIALRALLAQEGATGPEAALTVLKGSLLGLAAAHGQGVVHRDYKPENVLVAADGTSKLVDFGIAARSGTTPGVAGTPSYMAPEQWQGGTASPATDVYAATAVFFECLTGRKPYRGENFAELALQHIEGPVPLQEAPEPVRPLLGRGLAKSPQDRPAHAAAFVAELEEAAAAAYGPDWEERGQRRLAALTALLPLLLPSAGGPAGVADAATTALAPAGPAPGAGGWLTPGLRRVLAGVAAAVAAAVVAALALSPQAAADRPRAAAEALATTSAAPPAPGAAPSAPPAPATSGPEGTPSPSPSVGGSVSPLPSLTAPSPSPAWPTPPPPPSPSGPATGTPSAPPTTAAPPEPSPEPPAPTRPAPDDVRVVSVTVTSLRQTGSSTAAAVVEVVTEGTGPVTIGVAWSSSFEKGTPGVPEGTQSLTRSGASRYTVEVAHTFLGKGCYWGVTASTDPAAGQGGGLQQIMARRGCPVG